MKMDWNYIHTPGIDSKYPWYLAAESVLDLAPTQPNSTAYDTDQQLQDAHTVAASEIEIILNTTSMGNDSVRLTSCTRSLLTWMNLPRMLELGPKLGRVSRYWGLRSLSLPTGCMDTS
jgi:hypothetical protein